MLKVAAFVAIIVAGHLAGRSRTAGRAPAQCVSKIVFTFTLPARSSTRVRSGGVHPWATHPRAARTCLRAYPLPCRTRAHPPLRAPRPRVLPAQLLRLQHRVLLLALRADALFTAQLAVTTCLFDAGNAIMMTGGSYALTGLVAGKEPVEHPARFVTKRLAKSIAFDAYIILIVLAVAESTSLTRSCSSPRPHRKRTPSSRCLCWDS